MSRPRGCYPSALTPRRLATAVLPTVAQSLTALCSDIEVEVTGSKRVCFMTNSEIGLVAFTAAVIPFALVCETEVFLGLLAKWKPLFRRSVKAIKLIIAGKKIQ